MAPRTRSNRQESLAVQKLLSSGIHVNTRGLPTLPNELYLEILSYLPTIPIPQDVWVDKKPDPYRQLTLYYLSQTCRSLRKFFLRYAWERIEVFGGMWTPKGRLVTKAERNSRATAMKVMRDEQLSDEVLRQLETVTVRNPDLRQYVSIVNLTIQKYSYETLLPEIARNLTLFPDLHTLQLIYYYLLDPQIFSPFCYPTVHTLNLSFLSPYEDIVLACPNTKHFSFYKDIGTVHPQFLRGCAGVTKLGLLRGLEEYIASLAKYLPRLGDLSLDCRILRKGTDFNTLSSLPLHTIRLRLDDWHRTFHLICATPAIPDERRRWIDLAKGILANCPQHEAKRVIVVNFDNTVEVYNV